MYVVLLKFSDNKGKAAEFMKGHNDWIKKGLDDGKFLLVGSLKPNLGGVVIMHGLTQAEVKARVDADPFVAEKVVKAEILDISAARADARLEFLLE